MAAVEEWYFEEEGCLEFSGSPISVTFSPTSNCFICTLEDGTVEVVDARSSLRLKRTSPAENAGPLQCKFCPEVEKLFITNGLVSGLRKDLNGVLLLDSILQPPLKGPCVEQVVLEVTLTDAVELLSAMESCIAAAEEGIRVKCIQVVHSMLKEEVDKAQSVVSSSHDKAVKWCTCQLKHPCSALHTAFSDLATYLQKSCKNHAVLPVVSAIQSRTMYLLEMVTTDSKPNSSGNKFPMFMEAVRRKTFLSWPHKEYRWAYPEAMAKAGFYHQPSNRGDDRALCFTCNVCLVCWEPTDEPWSEHERHCPDCSFVRGDHTKNVPMAVSLATAPACAHETTNIKLISESSCSHYIATCSEDGHVIIWNIQDELKIHSEFQVDIPNELAEAQDVDESEGTGPPTSFVAWAEPENEEDMEDACIELQNGSEHLNEVFNPVGHEDEIPTPPPPPPPPYKKTSEECKNEQVQEESTNGPSENIDTSQENSKQKVTVCTLSIVCSCGKDPTNNASQKCQSFGHSATLVLAVYIEGDKLASDNEKAEDKNNTNAKIGTQLCPYILMYEILTDVENKPAESSSKQLFNIDSTAELEKEMQLMLTPSGSDDDWMYDQFPVVPPPPPPVLPPDTLHSSVLQKFAEAIAGDESEDKNKTCKSKKETNKHRKLVQCVELSVVCNSQCCKVSNIVPFGDGQNLLVSFVLCTSCGSEVNLDDGGTSTETGNVIHLSEDSSTATTANNSAQENNSKISICEHNFTQTTLAVYRIVSNNNGKRTLSQQPTRTKQFSACEGVFTSIVALPLESQDLLGDVCFQEAEAELPLPSQLFVAAVNDSVFLVDGNSLNILTKFTDGGSTIRHILNCPGMDCFCVCTDKGLMHFLGLRHQRAGETGVDNVGQESTDGISQATSTGSWSQSAVALNPDEPVTMACLLSLIQLTEFVTLMPRFTASVPSSWVEVQQDQQRLHQHSLLDPVLHTRTWKLRSDNSSFLSKEQVIELVLPRYCHVGHVDIRFSLSPMTTQPSTNVYLLKPPYPSSFKPKTFAPPVPEHCKKGVLASAREHSTIVCGPVNLKLGLDSTGRHGRVTLTSPELIKSSSRILMIAFDSCGPSEDLTEVSITVTRFKNNFPAECHKLRSSLLEDSSRKLLDIVVGTEPVLGATRVNDGRKLALELLCWIAGICVNYEIGSKQGHRDLIQDVEMYLPKLIQTCYLSCGRSIAHKCSRLLMMCGRKATSQRASSYSTSSFRRSLLNAILDVLRLTPCAVSSGAVHWLFKLLTGFAAQADSTLTSYVCLEMLELLSSKLASARLKEHLSLRARYGLYGCPLDPVLFDAVPQPPTIQQTPPIVNGLSALSLAVKGALNSGSSNSESWCGVNSPLACQGLLEVQPLHFVCCSTSDGARVERGDTQQLPGSSLGSAGASMVAPMMSGGIPSSATLAPTLPTVSASLAALEQELQMLKQHQQQLVSLQQHKQQLEKHKKELEDLSMLSLFPKFLYKAGNVWSPQPTTEAFPTLAGTPMSSTSTLINLAQHKKQTTSNKKEERVTGAPSTQPIQQHLLQAPQPQMLVIDRLHAGARHHVVLDFGCVVQLTDVLIPQCSDIMSLSIDVWTLWDDPDVQRVAVVSDINICACVLKDLLPPPVCRYVKLTVVGRPKTNSKARAKIGEFYGHPLCGQTSMTGETQLLDAGCHDQQCLPILHNLLEDIHCHYNMACTQLRILLQSSEPKNPRIGASVKGASLTEEEKKVHKAYNQCMNLQHQLNLVEQSINRLTPNAEGPSAAPSLDEVKYDHLQVICSCLIDTVVALMGVGPSLDGYLAKPKLALEWQPLSQVTPVMCENLFRNLCVNGSAQKRERIGALLLNACGNKPWWGEFLSNILKEYFSSNQKCTFPQERLFAVLVSLSQQSPSIELVLTSFLSLLDGLLPLKSLKVDLKAVDLMLVGWLLLLLQHVLDTCIVQCEPTVTGTENGENSKGSNGKNGSTSSSSSSKSKSLKPAKTSKSIKRSRWDFMLPMTASQPTGLSSESSSSRWQRHMKMSKYVFPKKAPTMKQSSDYLQTQQGLTKGNGKQSYKHMKDLSKLRRHADEGKPQPEKTTSQPTVLSTSTPLPANTTVPVMRKMTSFILSMNSTCSVELFLISCKVVAHLACVSEPSICLVDVVTDDQLEQLLRMCVMPSTTQAAHWGGPWASHCLTSLLQDLLQGGQGNQPFETPKNGTVQTPAAQENGTESPPVVTSIMDAKEKSILLDMEYSDLLDYDLPSEGEMQAPGWMEFGDISNGSEMPQPTPVHEKPATPASWETKIAPPPVKLSSAIDMRLELGLEMEAEQDLKMLEHLQVDAIAKALSTTVPSSKGANEQPRRPLPRNGKSSVVEATLQASFSKIFNDCNSPNVDIASLLQMWLKVRQCSRSLKLDTASLTNLLSHLVKQPGSSPKPQRHCLQVLTVVSEGQFINCVNQLQAFLSNEDLLRFLVTLLCQTPSFGSHTLSPSSKPVKAFLMSLQSAVNGHSDVKLSKLFQDLLLRTVLKLCTERLANRGADVQVEPVIDVLVGNQNATWHQVGADVVIRLVSASARLTLDYLTHKRGVSLLPSTDVLASSATGASVDKLDNSTWLVNLLSLIIQILQKLPDSNRNQVMADATPESCSRQESDEIQSDGGDTAASSNLTDKVVAEKEVLLCLLECLNQCSTDKQGTLSSAASLSQDKSSVDVKITSKPTSVEDGVLQLMSVIQNQVGNHGVLVDGILYYLQTSKTDESSTTSVKHLSDPLLWLLFKILSSSQAVSQFYYQGGLDIVCKAIVMGQATPLDHTSHGLLSVMQELTSRASRREPSRSLTSSTENDWTKRMINFAPYGSIQCTSSPKHPPDALLKATAQHRRARSAAWSYRFPANEEWCELVISLPTAILLQEVHIQPHSTGLSTCPSHVSLDISNESQVLVPVCEPVLTTGITIIKLKLQQPQVAQHVHIHCHCPRDSHVLGLSQIKVLGTSLHGSQSLVNQDLQSLKGQAVSLGWIQLLGQCLSQGTDLYQETSDPSTLLSDVFSTCVTLLLSPQSEGYSACLELVLMKLSMQFPKLGTMLIKQLLKCPDDKESMREPVVNVATVELIYQLGKKLDSSYQDRLSVMSSWLRSLCESPVSIQAAPGHIQAVAGVIWHAKETDSESIVRQHFSEELFRNLYAWSQNASDQDALKQSIDHLIGALSYICPMYYEVLLELTGTKLALNQHHKKGTSAGGTLTDLLSSPSRLATLATASQSAVTSQTLLNSGLLELMVQGIVDFCNSAEDSRDLGKEGSSSKTEGSLSQKSNCVPINLLPHLLSFLTCCCNEPAIKDWMGDGGYQFWLLLLSKLSGVQGGVASSISSYASFAVETATVELLCNCVRFHPRNQEKMACLLVETIGGQTSSNASDISSKPKVTTHVSGFIRQLILQMLLEEETIPICLHLENDLNLQTFKGFDFFHKHGWHPRFSAGHSFVLVSAKLSSTLQELSEQILLPKADKPVETTPDEKFSKPAMEGLADPADFGQYEGFEFLESVSLAAGLNVKSKRAEKNESLAAKESNPATSQSQNQKRNLSCSFYHELFSDVPLPPTLTLAQLLQSLMNRGLPCGSSFLELTCKTQGEKSLQDSSCSNNVSLLTPLDVFAKQDGLAQLSLHLPCHIIVPSSLTPDAEAEGSKQDSNEGRLPSYPTQLPLPLVSLPASVLSTVPAHSLVAFALFIRLPGYNTVLLQDRLRARYLLRLLLGAKQDSDGESILSSPVASSLSTLPFQVLRSLFQGSELVPLEGETVHRTAMEVGAIQMVLLCLAVLSHHKPRATNHSHKLALQALSALTGSVCRDNDAGAGNERTYWAKGTGFGTGSTSSGWDVEQAMLKQKAEEEHVTCLLQVLASYIKPFGKQSDSHKVPLTEYSQSSVDGSYPLVEVLLELLGESCLIPALSSYLRNDSVLDMARHVPLYQAVLEVLRAVALCPVLLPLLLPRSNGYSVNHHDRGSVEPPSIASLLNKMKQCVDTYSKTLRSTQGRREDSPVPSTSTGQDTTAGPSATPGQSSTGTPSTATQPSISTSGASSTLAVSRPGSSGQVTTEEKKDHEAEGLALLIPDIQDTAKLMQRVVHEYHHQQAICSKMAEGTGNKPSEEVTSMSAEEKYLAKMKPLQFGTHRIAIEKDDGKLEFDSGGYHFASSVRSAANGGGSGGMVRARRLAQEVSSLATSLPLSSSSSVFVRCDKERLDVMKVLITGPSDTPYANGCFEFDVYFPQNYPESPMYVNFETTGHHSIRFNPNLYNDGKVCLSILNTWHGRPEEKWNAQNSSFLQVLVSIQSLILVHEPYFNEPGYERSRGTPAGQQNSREYDANICQATVRWAMLEQLKKPSPCFKQVIQAHFYLKKDEILEQCEQWIKDTESLLSGRPVGRAMSHHVQSLKQNTALLKQELAKLEPPPDHKEEEDSDEDSD